MMDDPLTGKKTDNQEVFKAYHKKIIDEVYEYIPRQVYVVRLGGATWYECPVSALAELEERWRKDKLEGK